MADSDLAWIKAELTSIAAALTRGNHLPSDLVDDYPQKTYSASRVAGMVAEPRYFEMRLARRLLNAIDKL